MGGVNSSPAHALGSPAGWAGGIHTWKSIAVCPRGRFLTGAASLSPFGWHFSLFSQHRASTTGVALHLEDRKVQLEHCWETGGTEQELQLERAGASLCGFGGDQLFCCPASTTLCPEVQNHQGINRNYVHFLLHTRVCCSSCVPPWGYFTSQIPQNVSTQPSCRGQKEICSWCNPCVHKPFPQCSHRVMGWQFHQTKASFVISLLKTEHKASFADLPVFGPAWLSHSCFFQACPHPSCTSGAVGGTRTGTKEAGGGFYLKFQVMLSECVRHKNLSQI